MNGWQRGIAEWTVGMDAFVSVPFTWLLDKAYMRCVWLQREGYRVRCGGPAVRLMPYAVGGFADTGEIDALPHFNEAATFTTRGCIRRCSFCAVWRIEGDLRELPEWRVAPVICDNNITAASQRHFERVVDSMRGVPSVDFNQGIDCRLLKAWHLDGLRSLDMAAVRFAWDDIQSEAVVLDAISRTLAAGFPRRLVRAYVLVGFEDTPADAIYRCETLKHIGIRPNVMRYQPLNSRRKNGYVAPNWSARYLADFCRYWNRLAWLGGVPWEQFDNRRRRTVAPCEGVLQ